MARKKLPSHPSRHPLYSFGQLSSTNILSLDWSKLINTPTLRDGYGITDVYTEAEADALFLTAAAADALFLTPAEGDAAYAPLSHAHDWADITGEPTTLAGYGITDAYTDAEVDTLLAALSLDALDDVVLTAPADGDILVFDLASGDWINVAPAGGSPHALDAHTDVNAPTPSNGDVLTWDSTPGEWVNLPPAAVDFTDLTGTPTTLAGYGITDAVDGSGTAGAIPKWSDANTLTNSKLVDESSGTLARLSLSADGLAGACQIFLDGDDGQVKDLVFLSNGFNRWIFRSGNQAETGANAGSDFSITRRSDAGGDLGEALLITRSSGGAKFQAGVGFFNTAAPAAKPSVTGSRGGNAALASLLTALAATGILANNTTA